MPQGPFALAGLALLAATLIPFAVGVVYDLYLLEYSGVLSAYDSVSAGDDGVACRK